MKKLDINFSNSLFDKNQGSLEHCFRIKDSVWMAMTSLRGVFRAIIPAVLDVSGQGSWSGCGIRRLHSGMILLGPVLQGLSIVKLVYRWYRYMCVLLGWNPGNSTGIQLITGIASRNNRRGAIGTYIYVKNKRGIGAMGTCNFLASAKTSAVSMTHIRFFLYKKHFSPS